jgi:hypothetical protein
MQLAGRFLPGQPRTTNPLTPPGKDHAPLTGSTLEPLFSRLGLARFLCSAYGSEMPEDRGNHQELLLHV